MKMKPITITTFLLLLLLLVPLSLAAEDFSAQSFTEFSACPCNAIQSEIIVRNTGDQTSTYAVELSGPAAPYVSIAPDIFILQPGQSVVLYEDINIACGQIGEFDLFIDIGTSNRLVKRLYQEITMQNCVNIDVESIQFEQQICPGGEAFYTAEVENTGLYPETYDLGTDSFSAYSTFEENPIHIGAGEKELVKLKVKPAATYTENYQIEFYAQGQTSDVRVTTPFTLFVEGCFDHTFSIGDALLVTPSINNPDEAIELDAREEGIYESCSFEERYIPFQIENQGDFTNEFYLSIEDQPEWVTLDSNYVKLEPSQKGRFNVLAQIPEEVKDPVTFTVTSRSVFGEETLTKTVSLNGDNCFNPVIGGNFDSFVVRYDETITSIPLTNTGNRQGVYTVALETDQSWITVEPTQIVLGPEEELSVGIRTAPTQSNGASKYPVHLSLTSENGVKYQRTFTVDLRQKNIMQRALEGYHSYKWYIFAALVLIVILVVLALYRKHLPHLKKKSKKVTTKKPKKSATLSNQTKKEIRSTHPQGKPWWALILFIVLAVIACGVYYAFTYEPVKNFLTTYLWYVLAGILVILIILGISGYAYFKKKPQSTKPKEIKKELKKETKKELKKKQRKESKESQGGMSSTRSNWMRWIIIALVIIVLAVIVYVVAINIPAESYSWIWNYILGHLQYVLWAVLAILVLLIIAYLIYRIIRGKKVTLSFKFSPSRVSLTHRLGFKGIGELGIRLHILQPRGRLTIRELRKKPTFVRASEQVYRYYSFITTLDKDAYTSARIRFKVPQKWLKKHDIKPSEVVFKHFENQKWVALPTRRVDEDKKSVFFETKLEHFSYFAIGTAEDYTKRKKAAALLAKRDLKKEAKSSQKIVYEKQSEKVESKLLWPIVILAIILLLVIGNMVYFNFYAPEKQDMDHLDDHDGDYHETHEDQDPSDSLDTADEEDSTYHTDEVLSELADGTRYVYTEDNEVFDMRTETVLTKSEYASVLVYYQDEVIQQTSLTKETLNALITSLDSSQSILDENEDTPEVDSDDHPSDEVEESEQPTKPVDLLEDPIASQSIKEDAQSVLDLKKIIQDPDNDNLYYIAESTEHLTLNVNNEEQTLTIVPEKNWVGKEIIVISADDLKGGIVETELEIVVEDQPEPPLVESIIETTTGAIVGSFAKARSLIRTTWESVGTYVWYVLGGILVLVLLLLFIKFSDNILDFLEEPPQKKKR